MEIIDFNLTDFESNDQDFYTFMKYKGKPFTGTLKDEGEIIQFENGHANGKAEAYNTHGQLIHQDIYKDGESVSSKEWYANGQLLYDSEFERVWDSKGVLVKDNGHWLYSNQAPKTKGNYFKEGMVYLAPNGAKVAESVSTDTEEDQVTYYDEVLFKWYHEILINPCPELSSSIYYTNSYTRFIWGWIWKLFLEDPQQANDVLLSISKHENVEMAKDAKEMINDLKNPRSAYIKARWL